jgi:hypothetical protein
MGIRRENVGRADAWAFPHAVQQKMWRSGHDCGGEDFSLGTVTVSECITMVQRSLNVTLGVRGTRTVLRSLRHFGNTATCVIRPILAS